MTPSPSPVGTRVPEQKDPRPWRAVVDVPDLEWPDYETRYSSSGAVRRVDPASAERGEYPDDAVAAIR
jgi:hypothetical protein